LIWIRPGRSTGDGVDVTQFDQIRAACARFCRSAHPWCAKSLRHLQYSLPCSRRELLQVNEFTAPADAEMI
jgi:hypothetical protein